MPFVVISIGGEEVSRHPVTGPAVIGRSMDADISVRDASMSRWHCRIEPDPNQPVPATGLAQVAVPNASPGQPARWVISDLGSRNGTSVNGRRVTTSAALHHGDLVRIGRVNVSFSTGDFVPGPSVTAAPAGGSPLVRTHKRAPAPSLSAVAHGDFAKPLLTVDSRLPRPDPARPGVRKATAFELEIMSSPGWSAKIRPEHRLPTPSVDISPGEIADREHTRTVDITHLNPAVRAKVEELPKGLLRRLASAFVRFFQR